MKKCGENSYGRASIGGRAANLSAPLRRISTKATGSIILLHSQSRGAFKSGFELVHINARCPIRFHSLNSKPSKQVYIRGCMGKWRGRYCTRRLTHTREPINAATEPLTYQVTLSDKRPLPLGPERACAVSAGP